MSVFEPNYIWLASGGSNMLNSYRLLRLPYLSFVSPDQGEFDNWMRKTNIFDRRMDVRVEKAFNDGIVEAGADILDLILIEKGLNDIKNKNPTSNKVNIIQRPSFNVASLNLS